jgi:hypothetical protein
MFDALPNSRDETDSQSGRDIHERVLCFIFKKIRDLFVKPKTDTLYFNLDLFKIVPARSSVVHTCMTHAHGHTWDTDISCCN